MTAMGAARPDDRHHGQGGPLAARDGGQGAGDQGQGAGAQHQAEEGDQPGLEMVQADIDEEEGGSPAAGDEGQKGPVGGAEGPGVAALRGADDARAGARGAGGSAATSDGLVGHDADLRGPRAAGAGPWRPC